MKKESYVIESSPAEKNRFWKILIESLIIILLLAIIIVIVLSFSVYDYIQADKNETNFTDINTTQNTIQVNPAINGTMPPTQAVPNCTDGKKNGNEKGIDCGGSCKICNSGGGPGDPNPPCTPDCTNKNCGDDGCGGSCGPCTNAICNATGRCVAFVNCTADINCTAFTGYCGTGRCNITTKQCYSSFNSSSTICRNNVSDCDAIEFCSGGSATCGNDLNKSDGTSCSSGICTNGRCTNPGTCNNDPACSSPGNFCDIAENSPYTCSPGSDGCLDKISFPECEGYCQDGTCLIGDLFYLDAANGNDANNGKSPGTAWKTLERALPTYTGEGTKVVGGDKVMLKGTPTYATLNNVNIDPRTNSVNIDNCDSPWTVNNAYISTAAESEDWYPTFKVNNISIAANYPPSTKIAYKTISPIDLSSYSAPKIHFWIMQRNSRTSINQQDNIEENKLMIALCSDTTCNNIVAKKVINDPLYKGWFFKHYDLEVTGSLSQVRAVGLFTTSSWNIYAGSNILIDDIFVSDSQESVLAQLTKANHGYTFHEGDMAYITSGLSENSHSKIFEIDSANADEIFIKTDYGLENQFKNPVSLYIRDGGYGDFSLDKDYSADKWIIYEGHDGTPIFNSITLGKRDDKLCDYKLSFINIRLEQEPFRITSFITIWGVNNTRFENIEFNSFNKYFFETMRLESTGSADNWNIILKDSKSKKSTYGLSLGVCHFCLFKNNTFEDMRSSALNVNKAYDTVIDGNDFSTKNISIKDWWYMSPHGNGIGLHDFRNVTIKNNYFWDGFAPRGIGFYIDTKNSEDLIIESNVFNLRSNLIVRNADGDYIKGPVWILNNTFIGDRDYSRKPTINSSYRFVFERVWGPRYSNNTGSLGKSRIENNIVLGVAGMTPYFATDKNNIFWYSGTDAGQFYEHDPTTIILAENIIRKVPGYNLEMVESFFLDSNFSFSNNRKQDFHPLITSIICNGSLGQKGIAYAGALPCVCTNNAQCVEVFGSGSTCNTQTRKCEGTLVSSSITKPVILDSKDTGFLDWILHLFS